MTKLYGRNMLALLFGNDITLYEVSYKNAICDLIMVISNLISGYRNNSAIY